MKGEGESERKRVKEKGRRTTANRGKKKKKLEQNDDGKRSGRVTAAESEDGDRETQCEEQVGTQREPRCVNTHSIHQADIGTTLQHNKHFPSNTPYLLRSLSARGTCQIGCI